MLETKSILATQPANQDLEEFIDNVPGWLLRSGISVIALVVVSLIFIASYIKYPEKITGIGIMTSDTPPIEHFTTSGGLIDTIYVKQNSSIRAGERILFIQNTGRTEDVAALQQFISNYEKVNSTVDYCQLKFPSDLHLGELQAEYAKLELSFIEFIMKLKESDVRDQVNILEKEISNINKLNTILRSQTSLSRKELSLVEKDHLRNQSLKISNVISEADIEKSTREVLKYQHQHSSLENNFVENQIRIDQLKLEIYRTVKNRTYVENSYKLKIQEIISNLKQSVEKWEERYFVTAQITGTVSFASTITQNYRLTPNQLVASILPPNRSSNTFVRVNVSGKGMGRIKKGNRVILKIEGYPYKEFGSVSSYVTSVSLLPKEDKNGNIIHELIISLPNEIETNYKRKIPYSANTEVLAEVITEEKSIMHRILNEFLDLVKNA